MHIGRSNWVGHRPRYWLDKENNRHGLASRVAAKVIADLTAPLVMLPGQVGGPQPDESGEVTLLRYILLGAISDLIAANRPSRSPSITHERRIHGAIARHWLLAPEVGDRAAPISFAMCAAAFNLDPDELRRRLLGLSLAPRGREAGTRYLPRYGTRATDGHRDLSHAPGRVFKKGIRAHSLALRVVLARSTVPSGWCTAWVTEMTGSAGVPRIPTLPIKAVVPRQER